MCKVKRPNGATYKEERKTIEVFQEFYIEDITAIENIIEIFAVNVGDFDHKKFLEAK
jgi:hypothetical protein